MIYKCGLEVVVVVVIAVLSELRGVHARGEGGVLHPGGLSIFYACPSRYWLPGGGRGTPFLV